MNAFEYSEILKKRLTKDAGGWSLSRVANPDQNYEEEKFMKVLEYLGESYSNIKNDVDEYRGILSGDDLFSSQLKILSKSLKEDIENFTNGAYNELLVGTDLSFLPTGRFGGFALSHDDFESKLDGYVIGINEGLYFCLQLLAKALVFEYMDGDYLIYKKSGSGLYRNAINLYINPSSNFLNEIFFEGLPPEIDGELSAILSSIAMVMLQFIVLHEFGHIVNNDFSVMGIYKLYLQGEGQDENEQKIDKIRNASKFQEKHWNSEYLADEFAILAMSKKSKSNVSAWANFIAIYTLFHWFNDVQVTSGKIVSELHPPPMARAERLLSHMKNSVPGWEDYSKEIDWIDGKVKEWLSS